VDEVIVNQNRGVLIKNSLIHTNGHIRALLWVLNLKERGKHEIII